MGYEEDESRKAFQATDGSMDLDKLRSQMHNDLKKQMTKLEDRNLCIVCNDRPREVIFDCGHYVCCKNCGDNLCATPHITTNNSTNIRVTPGVRRRMLNDHSRAADPRLVESTSLRDVIEQRTLLNDYFFPQEPRNPITNLPLNESENNNRCPICRQKITSCRNVIAS